MRHNIKLTLAILALLSLIAAAIILADATGQISGRIIDSHTGLPIVGATVLVVGTNRGANTDLDGKFVISLNTASLNLVFRDETATAAGSTHQDAAIGFDSDGDGDIDETITGFSYFLGLND